MDAKKCDRCGTYYETRTMTGFEAAVEALRKMTVFDPAEIENKIISNFDLCPDCKKSLRKWLHFKDTKETEG